VLKSSPTAQTILAQGTEASIHDLDTADMLHVDMQGSNFSFSINDHVVGQAKDADYAAGEVGFYAQTVDATNIHIHFDSIVISQLDTSSQTQAPAPVMLYQDDFTNSASGWPEQKFDNYFIGYHEPEYYHVEIDSPNYKTTVFEPNKTNYGDAAIEVKVFTVSAKTSKTGDFSYGIAFRRSGDLYYAFTISPRTKQWTVLKNSPTAQTVLIQGTEASIHDLDTADVLRVEVQGPDFTFSINDHVVGEAKDADYAAGEVGFYAQTVDATNIHIHFDSIAVSEYTAPLACTVNALSLNVRTGPGTSFASSAVLSKGDMVTPIGRTEDGTWIKVMRENNPDPGWIYSDKKFVSCSSDVKLLPAADQ
jgi:hypothetical protein